MKIQKQRRPAPQIYEPNSLQLLINFKIKYVKY